MADPQSGGCSKKKIWLIRNLVCAQQKDLADPQFGGCSEKKDLADPEFGGRSEKIDLADPQFGGCSEKKIWLICKKTIRSGGRVWAYPRKRRSGRSLRLRGWGSGNPPSNYFFI